MLQIRHLSPGENRALSESAAIKHRINRIFNRWNTSDEAREQLLSCKRLRTLNGFRWDLSTGFQYTEIGKADTWARALTFRELVKHSRSIWSR